MLELRNLTKSYGGLRAVNDVSLEIREGEFFSLLGPSGCGKTSLLRMLGGFEAPNGGQIWMEGRRIDPLPPHQRNFNMVFQRYALFPHLNVRENLAFGLRMKKVRSDEITRRVDEALAQVRLEGLGGRAVTTLSGGQQQRVALARALINRPRVLLLDEPLSALDLKLRQEMQVELRALQKRLKITFIFVTHDQDEALTLSDRVAVMNAGRVEQLGSPREIYEYPQTEFVAGFIGSINALEGKVNAIEGPVITVSTSVAGPFAVSDISNQLVEKLKPGAAVRLLIRPEKLRLLKSTALVHDARAPVNEVAGRVKEVIYHGPQTRFVVQTQDEAGRDAVTLSSSQSNLSHSVREEFFEGDAVRVQWSPGDCVLLPREAPSGPA